MYWNTVAKFILKIGSFVPQSLDLGLTIGNHTGGETADFGGDVKHVGDGFGVHEAVRDFFLGYDAGCVGAAEGDSCEARGGCCGFECVFHLIEASLWREDGDVVIIV